ncbi:hypothetical protein [Jhaorihella thermophila]|uniref:hypothetical protein n=1 Tax=Jhaorihella thermophila TaxID=488547 RepID=UPI003608FAEA
MGETLRLGDFCSKIGSGATPRGGKDSYLEIGPFALIRSQNVYNHGFERTGLAYISENQANALSNVEVQTGDVLLNITGDSVARACQVTDDVLPARVNQHVAIIRPDGQNVDARFLRYYLVSPTMQAEMLALASAGATRPALTKGMIPVVVNILARIRANSRSQIGSSAALTLIEQKISGRSVAISHRAVARG